MTVGTGTHIEAIVEYTLDDGTIAQNGFTFKAEFAADQTDAAVTSSIESWVEAAYNNLSTYLPDTMSFNLSVVNQLTWQEADQIWKKTREIGEITPTITRSATLDELPNQVSAVVTYTTERPKTRGRTFLPPFTEPAQDQGNLVSAALADVVDFVGDAISDKTISAGNILRRVVIREAVNASYDILSGIAASILGTQRRRRQGVGA
jgi:hypothetical protein